VSDYSENVNVSEPAKAFHVFNNGFISHISYRQLTSSTTFTVRLRFCGNIARPS